MSRRLPHTFGSIVGIVALGLASVTEAAEITFSEIQITAPGPQTYAAISGDRVVFKDSWLGGIAYAEIASAVPVATLIYSEVGNVGRPSIDGDLVVFDEQFPDLVEGELILHDLSTSISKVLYLVSPFEPVSDLRISGTDIVMEGYDCVDFTRCFENVRVTDTTGTTLGYLGGWGGEYPDVAGSVRAWRDKWEVPFFRIFFQVSGGTSIFLPIGMDGWAPSLGPPSVGHGFIAYTHSGDVWMYEIATELLTQITDDGTDKENVKAGDDVIAWSESTGNRDIYLHYIPTGQTWQLTNRSSSKNLTDLDGNRIAFDESGDIFVIEFDIEMEMPESVPAAERVVQVMIAALLLGLGAMAIRRATPVT